MTPKQSFINALELRAPTGSVPHFELEFFLTMEAFGRVHPSQRQYRQWQQMSEHERRLHIKDVADLHVTWVRAYEMSGMLVHPCRGWGGTEIQAMASEIAQLSDQQYLVTMHGDATYALPSGDEMMGFVERLADDPQGMRDEAARRVDEALDRAQHIRSWGTVDGFCLCSDYCFNDNPFLSPAMFDDFVAPYLKRLVAGYRELGFYVIKHTDGNIMPILDSLVSARPHALHSIDPQGKVDIAEVKKRVGDKVCLIGNVNCGLLDTGTDQQVIDSAKYALQNGMPGGGYIFSTSNCIYTGMPLKRYELILDIWRKEGHYRSQPETDAP